jgi:hypothetical protein
MDQEREQQRRTYQLCRFGFGMLSFSLMVACLSMILVHIWLFFRPAPMLWIFRTRLWHWSDVPVVWGSLLGTYLLWGRWSDTGWQRRSGLLVLMCVCDAFLWFLEHGAELGLRLSEVGHEWVRMAIGQSLGWAQFALIASLSCDLMAHLGVEQAPEAGKSTRSLAATGAVVWFFYFLEQTIWKTWPLRQRQMDSLESLLLYLGFSMIWMITLIQVTALSVATTRQAGRMVAEMDLEDQENDLFRPPSENDFDLLAVQHPEPTASARPKSGDRGFGDDF